MKDQVHLIILICTLITMGWRRMISFTVQKNLQTLLWCDTICIMYKSDVFLFCCFIIRWILSPLKLLTPIVPYKDCSQTNIGRHKFVCLSHVQWPLFLYIYITFYFQINFISFFCQKDEHFRILDLKYDVTITTVGVFLVWAFCFHPAEGNLAIWDAHNQGF